MSLFIRIVTSLTVLLSLALMAVSSYAATIEGGEAVPGAASAVGAIAPDTTAYGVAPGGGGGADDGAIPWLHAQTQPTPTAVLRYAAPVDAAAVSGGGGGRDNLSAGARVWNVVSIKPAAVDVGALGRGGLEVPPEQLEVMLEVSEDTGIPWQVFAAIAKVESDFGNNMATSWAGAIGYGQFLPSSWVTFGEGGDPYDFRDVIPAMGRYLVAAGIADDVQEAIYAYNHSWTYVAQVLSYAASYGYPSAGPGMLIGMAQGLSWPVVGPISSYFSEGHPLGIDIDQTMAPGTPVLAAHDGAVLFAGGDPCCSYGYYVILVAPSGITTLYAHFNMLTVSSGQTVRQGQPLGIVGCTGYCTGTHVHFELIDAGVRRDPLDYLP